MKTCGPLLNVQFLRWPPGTGRDGNLEDVMKGRRQVRSEDRLGGAARPAGLERFSHVFPSPRPDSLTLRRAPVFFSRYLG